MSKRVGIVEMQYISTENQLADIFTKPLVEERFLKIRDLLSMSITEG